MKKKVILLCSVLATIIAAWSIVWLVLMGIIRSNIDQFAHNDKTGNLQLACSTLNIGGFPFRFDIDCLDVRIAGGDVTASVPNLRASMRIYAPTHVLAAAEGPIQIEDNFTGSRSMVGWSSLEASFRLDNWRIARVSAIGQSLVWTDTLFNAEIARSTQAEIHLFDMPDKLDPDLHLAGLALYGRIQNLIWSGPTLDNGNVEVQLELSGLPDDVRDWGYPDLLRDIQAADGELRVVAIRGTDGDVEINADGLLKLNAQGMLDGQITLRTIGIANRIASFFEEPWPTIALGASDEDGFYTNQINIRNGLLSLGLLPIAPLPSLF